MYDYIKYTHEYFKSIGLNIQVQNLYKNIIRLSGIIACIDK